MSRKIRHGKGLLVALSLLAVLCGVLVLTAGPLGAEPTSPDLEQLMSQTGLKYSQTAPTVWVVPFDGDSGRRFEVFVTYNDDGRLYALIFTTVVDRADGYQYGREVLAEALKISNDIPGCKLVLDQDYGDIDCQSEQFMENLTTASLIRHIELVAAMADKYYKMLNDLAK